MKNKKPMMKKKNKKSAPKLPKRGGRVAANKKRSKK
jgi:hypothetical protein